MPDYSGAVTLFPQDPDIAERMRMTHGGKVYLDHGRPVEAQYGPRRTPSLVPQLPPDAGMQGTVPVSQLPPRVQQPAPPPKPRKRSYEELKAEADMMLDKINQQTKAVPMTQTAVQNKDEVPDWLRNYAKENGLM